MASYSTLQRRRLIFDILKEKGHVAVNELSEMFNVSKATVRKDLRELEQRNLLTRTHGGALLSNYITQDLPLEAKSKKHADEKQRIGRAAASLIKDHEYILLDAGTTTLQVARCLTGKQLTVATNSVYIALELLRMPQIEVIILGGIVRTPSTSVIGPYAEKMLREHYFHKLFLGVDGFDLKHGLTTMHSLEAHINRCMIESAQQTIVVTDSSKFGKWGMSRICQVTDIHMVITDAGIPSTIHRALEELGIHVMVV